MIVLSLPLEQRTIGHVLATQAERIGARTFLLWKNDRFSYADIHAQTNRYANGFAAAGIKKGDHVAVMLGNCPEFLFTVWGLGKIGAVAIPLNTAAKGELLAYYLTQSDCTRLVTETEFSVRLAELLPNIPAIQHIFCLGESGALARTNRALSTLGSLAAAPATTPSADAVAHSDPAFIVYTSGTTGPSKGAVSPHAQGQNVGRDIADAYGYTPDDVLYACLPLFHVNALWYSANAALWAGATLALAPRFSASAFWEDIIRTGATQFNALGAMASVLLKQPPSEAERNHKLRQSMVVPLSKEAFRDYATRFRLKVTSVFAATETFAVTLYGPNDPPDKAASAGHPRTLAEIIIADEHDRALPSNQVGEILVRPREAWLTMLGYYKMPEATVSAFRNQWFHTGDRGYLDADGFLWFVDRKKETIRRRGENISAYEVEMLIARHSSVHEVAAVAVPSDLSEDDVMVYVVRKPDAALTETELIQFCIESMSYFMVPRYVAFVDTLPKTASEKIEKYKLKQIAEATRQTLWDREKAGIILKRS